MGAAIIHLYDRLDGGLVGQWCPKTGRAQLGMDFYLIERPNYSAAAWFEAREGLKPCPFCGHAAEAVEDGGMHMIECSNGDKWRYCPNCGSKVVD